MKAQPWHGWMSLGRDVDSFQRPAHEPVEEEIYGVRSLRCKCAEGMADAVADCPLDQALDQAFMFGYYSGHDAGRPAVS